MPALDGKVALVTGGGRGIGRQLARKLAAQGARLLVNDADAGPAAETAELIRARGGTAEVCAGSITEPDFGARFVGAALEAWGRLDIIVNNAGFSWDNPIQEATDEQWDLVHAVNLKAPFQILRAATGYLRSASRAEREQGREVIRKVVNVSSMSATRGNARQAAYSAAKAGLAGLTRTLAKEWGRYRVTVNCVAFGPIATRQTRVADPAARIAVAGRDVPMGVSAQALSDLTSRIPLGRLGHPEEAADAIYLFCLPESNYISGQVIEVGGGLSA